MNVGVFFHVTLLMETFATVTAGERSSIAVYQQMGGEGAGPFKAFSALFTLEHLFHIMYSSIKYQRNKKIRKIL